MRAGALWLVLAGCGRAAFDPVASSDGGSDAVDASAVCPLTGHDAPSWPMPNDPGSGLPNIAARVVEGGRVRDSVTNLEWQRTIAPGMYTWSAARDYCQTLELDGGCWRLPERIELASIVNYTASLPSIDGATFPATPSTEHWTATAVTGMAGRRWVVKFDVGYIQHSLETTQLHVRCVRGTPDPSPRFVPTANTVLDNKTSLTWQRMTTGTYNWTGATTYCANLTIDANPNWRAPSIQELETLLDTTRTGTLIDPVAFPGAMGGMHWSRNQIQNDSTMGWTVDFTLGYAYRPVGAMLPTRCVTP